MKDRLGFGVAAGTKVPRDDIMIPRPRSLGMVLRVVAVALHTLARLPGTDIHIRGCVAETFKGACASHVSVVSEFCFSTLSPTPCALETDGANHK